ncbi:MAG: peptidase S49 [Candidatus Muproteobacteria bacterium RIFCSPHIGHO2_12_FULL_60_33]|uniref:Peptidase S49 n=1 Tax=Candidatus Muproteobacteria bacterium RIFCSPLOWO2_01_FULL_60_18 TaxID=1817768 RepID=A0A1F6TYJ0_9PROT|nr:MAG: peptidase S49 [Candidatus Muproteobacteria bacterium RIFCSPLOWO2_01_FULL_60_18]OGI53706.1 MAG: peptidase S49 [Candidatus Muproteobacteria bacterium RIFCSPHIGHO2_01_60_12]OGI53743.1 MAG: peptidase S49 [Candidatus Muproteobacteria bacterium RIFCSPHIGHO2_02_FULL_60_13]OGI56040.1 MAG: peptidase S49 [Candidatus Muproteobacteria bacterium RIFCSPHIGHO2_12_FULL_60_33]OGI58623.1 MAG: peptidase S49 [Candidatus Muproteobacteria bacterium RIFCSPHIGHO2_01_FULL_61_200]
MTDDTSSAPVSSGAEGRPPRWERDLLERLAFASLTEQRRARRWGIFFKLFFAAYLVLILVIAQSNNWGGKGLAARHTALIEMEGVISADSLASADNVISGLRAAFESTSAQGIVLRANSPGGSPVQAGYINDEIKRLRAKYPRIPIYAVIGDVCASGCYYAVAAADKIYADKASVVGSIGVLMNGFGFVDTMKKVGVERRLMTAGEHKGFLDPFGPVKPAEAKHAQLMLDEIHQQFINTVRQGRGKTLKETRDMFSGLFWTGEEAIKMGLVDSLGGASYVAREVIGAEEIVDYTYRENVFDRFARRLGTAMAQTIGTDLLGRTPVLK